MNPEGVIKALSGISRNPIVVIIIFSLLVPIILLYGATKFVDAQSEALIFFALIGVLSLAYSVWVISSIKKIDSSLLDKNELNNK